MSKLPLVSVIVPVYQAEKYLDRCINSILSQSFKDWELLLIDDGSLDGSSLICDQYASKDQRIRVIHKENGGVSSARQLGNELAIGEYTIHVDPDDWVESDMLEDLYRVAEAESSDMVICDYFWDKNCNSILVKQKPNDLSSHAVLYGLFSNLHGSSCNKLLKRKVYQQYNVKYQQDLNFCEDLVFNVALLMHPLNISYIAKAYYHYVQYENTNSLSRRYNDDILKRDWELLSVVTTLTNGTPYYAQSLRYMHSMIVNRAFWSGFFNSSEFRSKFRISKKYVIQSDYGLVLKVLLYLSCIGLYRPILYIINLVKRIR